LAKGRIANYEQRMRQMGLKQAEMLARCPEVTSACLLLLEE
jgi:hypothetical protein